jgi:hypothetical protein
MPRSEESRTQRLEYGRRWRTEHPDYHKAWKKDHSVEELERLRRWKAYNQDLVRAHRVRYYQLHYRPSLAPEPLPGKFQGHPFFETARFVCGERPYVDDMLLWEEKMAEAVLALVQGLDPVVAVSQTVRRELDWLYSHPSFHPNIDVREDGRICYLPTIDTEK